MAPDDRVITALQCSLHHNDVISDADQQEMCQYDTDAPTQGSSSPGNKHFAKKLRNGYNSHNNWRSLPSIEPGLYFMIMYLCIKYESNMLIFSKDIQRKLFFVHTDRMMKLKKDRNSHKNL